MLLPMTFLILSELLLQINNKLIGQVAECSLMVRETNFSLYH